MLNSRDALLTHSGLDDISETAVACGEDGGQVLERLSLRSSPKSALGVLSQLPTTHSLLLDTALDHLHALGIKRDASGGPHEAIRGSGLGVRANCSRSIGRADSLVRSGHDGARGDGVASDEVRTELFSDGSKCGALWSRGESVLVRSSRLLSAAPVGTYTKGKREERELGTSAVGAQFDESTFTPA